MEEEKKGENAKFTDIGSMSVKRLIELGDECYDNIQMKDAQAYYEQAVIKDPNDQYALITYTDFLCNIKDYQKAEILLEKVCRKIHENTNTTNYKPFFQLAQIKEGEISLQLYQKGIEGKDKELVKDLAGSYAAIAELYQTDFLQQKQSENITKCLQLDPNNLDGLLQKSNYHLNKEDEKNSNETLQQIFQLIKEKSSIDEQHNNIEFLMQIIKLFVEVEFYKEAVIVLEPLSQEDENNVEVLYFLAFCNFKRLHYYSAQEYVQAILAKPLIILEDDQEVLDGTKELQNELSRADFTQSKDGDDYEDCDDDDDDEQWMDMEHGKN